MGKKLTYEYVKEYIESFGYELLSEEYVNIGTKLLLKCPKGHLYEVNFRDFKFSENRCMECHNEIRSKNLAHTYEYVKEYIESFDYKLLSNEYKNGREKILVECSCGNQYLVGFDKFKQGQRCPKCANKHKNDKIRLSYGYVKQYIESFNYKLLSDEYINNKKKLKIECPKGHIFELNFDHFKNKERRCPLCGVSKGEQRIINWLDKNNINYIYDQPYFKDLLSPLGNPLRPDFIIEDKKVWVEFDGEFHFRKMYDEQNYETLQIHDNLKNEYAMRNNWKLIRIPYWDFDNIEVILEKELK